jgi:hypothetical protein
MNRAAKLHNRTLAWPRGLRRDADAAATVLLGVFVRALWPQHSIFDSAHTQAEDQQSAVLTGRRSGHVWAWIVQ